MLQRLREKAQGWLAWVILGMIAITFVLFGTSSIFSDTPEGERLVAKVNGTKITAHQLEEAYQQLLRQPGNEAYFHQEAREVKRELLQSLIEQAILLEAIKRMGMRVSPADVNQILAGVPFLQDQRGRFSQEAYQRFLSSAHYTDTSFRQLLQEGLLREQLQQAFLYSAFALEYEVADLAKFLLQKRSFRYTLFPLHAFEKEVKLSQEAEKAYYESHQKDFFTPEKVALEYVVLSMHDLMKNQATPTAEVLLQFYNDNRALFTQKPRVQVRHILVTAPKDAPEQVVKQAKEKIALVQKKLHEGASFKALAKEYSEDTGTASMGGDLDWFEAGEMIPEFEAQAFRLKEGEVSPPFRTDFGFHLVQLIANQPEIVRPYEAVRETVLQQYHHQQAEEEFIQLADQLNTLAFENPETLEGVQERLHLPLQRSALFSKEDGPSEVLLQHPDVLAAAFSESVKQDKHNSDLIKFDDAHYVVLRLAEHVAATQAPFETVQPAIHSILMNQSLENLAHDQANKVMEDLLSQSKRFNHLTWVEKKQEGRATQTLDSALLQAVFSMPRPNPTRSEPILKVVRLSNGDFVVVQLQHVQDGEYDQLPKTEKQHYETALKKHWGELEFSLYLNTLVKQASIKKYLDRIE